jgi:hypothetical protein
MGGSSMSLPIKIEGIEAWAQEKTLRKARTLLQSGAAVKDVAKKTKLNEGVVRKLAKELRAT